MPYRTTSAEPTFQALSDPNCRVIPDNRPFPAALILFVCATATRSRSSARPPTPSAPHYLGVCCGARPHHLRSLAEALGRRPPASRYSPDMSKHILFGTDKRLWQENLAWGRRVYGQRPADA